MKEIVAALCKKFTSRMSGQGMKIRWLLVLYDFLVYLIVIGLLSFVYHNSYFGVSIALSHIHFFAGFVCIFGWRLLFRIYNQVWRYGDLSAFMLLMVSDFVGGVLWAIYERMLGEIGVEFYKVIIVVCLDLLFAYAMRMVYHYIYVYITQHNSKLLHVLNFMTGSRIKLDEEIKPESRIKIAILGAGRVGTSLLNELRNNPSAPYLPVCFIDKDKNKVGRSISDLPIVNLDHLKTITISELGIQEVVFAVPNMELEHRQELYNFFKGMRLPVKVYDFPQMDSIGCRSIRDFDVEELLFRQQINVDNEKTSAFYRGKVILITGGGGSIGSEICRQLAKMEPEKLVILDVAENGAYDVQQELKLTYGQKLNLSIEIASVRDKAALRRIFAEHRPEVVIMAAAHKHVPLMEKNCIEAVENNVFGTLNTVEVSEEFGVERVIMVSTDKAVNPTNVMGATKRMCEMIVQAHSQMGGKTTFSATRFGNVLGSAGSVIPLFKMQIAKGGPVTITDKRIIRYFMTIPEASQLVLQSGAMAKNGELFVLDMGKPVKIYDLAENMIRLSGFEPGRDIEIREIGLRPGEKLYEELLIRSENQSRTENDLIMVEKDNPITMEELSDKLNTLKEAIESGTDESVREAMKQVVPTYKTPQKTVA